MPALAPLCRLKSDISRGPRRANCRLMHRSKQLRYSNRGSSQSTAPHIAFCRFRDICNINATLGKFLHLVMRRNRLCAPNVEQAGRFGVSS